MAQNLQEIGRLPNLGVKMDKDVYKNKEPPSEIGRVGISENLQFLMPDNQIKIKTGNILIHGAKI